MAGLSNTTNTTTDGSTAVEDITTDLVSSTTPGSNGCDACASYLVGIWALGSLLAFIILLSLIGGCVLLIVRKPKNLVPVLGPSYNVPRQPRTSCAVENTEYQTRL